VGGRAKTWEDGPRRGRTGQDTGQGKEGRAKGRGAGNVMDGLGQAAGLPGGVPGHGQRVARRAILRGPGLLPDVPGIKKRMRPQAGATGRMSLGCPQDILEAPGSPP